MFRYFHLLAPVLGDDSVFAEVDSSAPDVTLQPFMDKDPDMCRFKCNQIHSISANCVTTPLDNYTQCYCANTS